MQKIFFYIDHGMWHFKLLMDFDVCLLCTINLKGPGQLPPKTIGILTKLFCTSGPNSAVLAWMGNELWCEQAQNGGRVWLLSYIWSWRSRSIAPQGNRDLNQCLLHLWYKFGYPSLNGSELSRGQASDWYTHTHIRKHKQTQVTTIPEG